MSVRASIKGIHHLHRNQQLGFVIAIIIMVAMMEWCGCMCKVVLPVGK